MSGNGIKHKNGESSVKKMKFCSYYCGMSEEHFTNEIMIYKPISCNEIEYKIYPGEKLTELIMKFSKDISRDASSSYSNENICLKNAYIFDGSCLFGIAVDKDIEQIIIDFGENISIVFFHVGGASEEFEGYKFIIHPNEEIHRYLPHCHVEKGGKQVRYSLVDLQPLDKIPKQFQKDWKKKIYPYLTKNQKRLKNYWDKYMLGYIPPIETEEGKQIYAET